MLRLAPHPLPERPRVGLDLPYLGRAGHDSGLKDRDVRGEDISGQEKSIKHHP